VSPVDGPSVDRVVVVGSGSAGQRHASTLRSLLPAAELVVVRRTPGPLPDRLAQLDPVVESSVADAVRRRPHVVVVASPATHHAEDATEALRAGAHVLVEKPLAATIADAESIAVAASEVERSVVVGYHLRFGRVAPLVAGMVRSGALGALTSFRFEVGQHLDQWRPGTDPRRSVSARQELGGGVLLELSHEVDAVRLVVGDVRDVTATLSTDGAPTDGKVETVADLVLRAGEDVPGEVHLDMTSQTPFRRWTVDGEQGSLRADLLTGRVELLGADGTVEVLSEGFDGERELAEERLVAHLLDVVEGASPECTVEDGLAALAVVEAARRSAATCGTVAVDRTAGST